MQAVSYEVNTQARNPTPRELPTLAKFRFTKESLHAMFIVTLLIIIKNWKKKNPNVFLLVNDKVRGIHTVEPYSARESNKHRTNNRDEFQMHYAE